MLILFDPTQKVGGTQSGQALKIVFCVKTPAQTRKNQAQIRDFQPNQHQKINFSYFLFERFDYSPSFSYIFGHKEETLGILKVFYNEFQKIIKNISSSSRRLFFKTEVQPRFSRFK